METKQPIFVTGASGFVGRHVVRRLCGRGYEVRALSRRAPEQELGPGVQAVTGDLNKPESYRHALDGVCAVVHAALTSHLSHEPRATAALVDQCVQAGVRKFVHLSSIAVYGNPPDGTITEETMPIPSSDAYSQTKLAIEEALQGVTILRLGCVYGPGGGWWTAGLLKQMQRGKLILVNEGTGIANLIHVSDAALMVALAVDSVTPLSGIFNVTDGMPVAWSRYFAELEKIMGRRATVSMSAAEAREHGKRWLKASLASRVIRKITGAPLIHPLDERGIEAFASRAVYSNQKVRTTFGFAPEYDLESGMRTG